MVKRRFSNNHKLQPGGMDDLPIDSSSGESSPLMGWMESTAPGKARPEAAPSLSQHLLTDLIDTDSIPREYDDKHSLPATCNAAAYDLRQPKFDPISVLSHELLSPLTLIKGYTSTLLQLNKVITDEQREQYLEGIEMASNRLIHLLENLRDITRLEETDFLNIQTVSLNVLLRKTVSEMQSQTIKHVIKLRNSDHLPMAKVDPEKIEQVMNNLLANAIKYSPQVGDIEVDVRIVRNEREMSNVSGDTPPVKLPCFIVSVDDRGIGIPEMELERIFEKFYRVNSKLIRATPGAGLGLYICKIIVDAHGGRIWAHNRPQGGSIFSFSLPLGL